MNVLAVDFICYRFADTWICMSSDIDMRDKGNGSYALGLGGNVRDKLPTDTCSMLN
jgi:hypothetical protein